MAKKHPSGEQIQAMLKEGHFGAERELPAADPVSVTQLLVEVDHIRPYDHNPRRERNPQYDDIKDSIRAQGGLNNPLTITRRPGESLYVVESGGNTRLQILKELWMETQDERFHRIHCLFRPWVSEAHVLTAHLIENDTRGDLIFIDRALAVRELRRIMEGEAGRALSLRQLAEALQSRGYGLAPGMLSRMDYAVDVLLPLIPETLRAGLGRPQIERIRRLESVCCQFWCDERGEDSSQFEALFANTLSEHDGPGWNLDKVQQRLEAGLAEVLDISLKHVRLEIDARLAGERAGVSVPLPPSAPSDAKEHVKTGPDSSPVPESHSKSTTNEAAATPASVSTHPTLKSEPTPTLGESPPEIQPFSTTPVSESDSDDLEFSRRRALDLARRVAECHGLQCCVKEAPALGMGYLIDVPEAPIIPIEGRPDAAAQRHRQWVWWLLLSLSEQVVDPDRLARTPEPFVLRNLILGQNEEQVLALVGEPDWKALGYELLSNPGLDDHTIDNLLDLARTCRQIRQAAGDIGGLALWPHASL